MSATTGFGGRACRTGLHPSLTAAALLSALLGSVLTSPAPLEAQDARGQQVVDRALEALGGRRALNQVRTLEIEGQVELLSGFPGTFRSWARAPDQWRAVWDIGPYRHERGYDGQHGWERTASVREVVGIPLRRLELAARFLPLLQLAESDVPPAFEGTERVGGERMLVVRFDGGSWPERFYFDRESHLPLRHVQTVVYEEGEVEVTRILDDYRRTGGVLLPYRLSVDAPDLPYSVRVDRYRVNEPPEEGIFRNPEEARLGRPYDVSLATIPRNVYQEADGLTDAGWVRYWGIPFGPTASWTVNVLVREAAGRHVEPVSSHVELRAGNETVRTVRFSASALEAIKAFPVARFFPQEEVYHFRHHFTAPADLGVDAMVYRFRGLDAFGSPVEAELEIPVRTYEQKTRLVFPVPGPFVVTNGHEFDELGHTYEWSQQFAYDIVGVGPGYSRGRLPLERNEAYTTFGRELVAPAAGTVVHVRDGVPDMMAPRDYLKLEDPMWAIGGNSIVIDHGDGEFSAMFHMKNGSLRVRVGDRVEQGEVVGEIGSSGSPGFPHVHYQLQASPQVFGTDGLPVRFENVEPVGWLSSAAVSVPRRGVFGFAR